MLYNFYLAILISALEPQKCKQLSFRSFLPTSSNPAETLYQVEENYFADDELPKVHMVQPNHPSTSHFESDSVSRSAPSGLKYVLNPAYMSDFMVKNHNEVSSDCSSTNTPLNVSRSGSSTSSSISTEKLFPTSDSKTYNDTFCTSSGSDRYFPNYFLRSTYFFLQSICTLFQ